MNVYYIKYKLRGDVQKRYSAQGRHRWAMKDHNTFMTCDTAQRAKALLRLQFSAATAIKIKLLGKAC